MKRSSVALAAGCLCVGALLAPAASGGEIAREIFGPLGTPVSTAGWRAAGATHATAAAYSPAPLSHAASVATRATGACCGGTTTYYAPSPVTSYYAPAPVTSYYAPVAAPVTTYYTPTPVTSYYAPAPVTTYYAPAQVTDCCTPAAAPVTSYYAPAPVTAYYAPAPVTSYYAPAPVVTYYGGPVVYRARAQYVPGQPIRNVIRAITPW